ACLQMAGAHAITAARSPRSDGADAMKTWGNLRTWHRYRRPAQACQVTKPRLEKFKPVYANLTTLVAALNKL
ncbi:hypothetical protein, partial [Luteimonas terrae]|uniref:hypothetical protein n=1 Tax=Luteimonas terrae TaxID=1530191 RepID=UPI00286B8851